MAGTAPVLDMFRRNPPEYIVGDNLAWLDKLVLQATGHTIDTKELLAVQICEMFDFIRAYHGTRISDTSHFYSEGLVRLDVSRFKELAANIFLTPEFPELTLTHLEEAFSAVGVQTREGLIYFAVNHKELLSDCSHYLLYGSEYLLAIAAHIEGARDYRQVLKRRGTPTLFVCNVPTADIPFSLIREYAGKAIATMFERALDPGYAHPQVGAGGGLWIAKDLAPSNIVSHRHPSGLRDQFLRHC